MPIHLGDDVFRTQSSRLRLIDRALTERPACFEIEPKGRAVKRVLDVGRTQLITAYDFRYDLLFTMSDITLRTIKDRGETKQMYGRADGHPGAIGRLNPTQRLGGARRDRTDDLLLAKQALSQLSYGPGTRGAWKGGGPGKT